MRKAPPPSTLSKRSSMHRAWPHASSSSRGRFSSSTTARLATSAPRSATGPRRSASACWYACGYAIAAAAPTTADSSEVPPELRLLLEMRAFLGEDLGRAFRREAQLDKGRADIGDFAVFRDLAVAELHHRHTLEAHALAIGLGQLRDVAERVIGVEHLPVAHRPVHVPAEVARRAMEPVVHHFSDFFTPFEGTVEDVVIDAVLGEQAGECLAVAAFDGGTEFLQQCGCIHDLSSRSCRNHD